MSRITLFKGSENYKKSRVFKENIWGIVQVPRKVRIISRSGGSLHWRVQVSDEFDDERELGVIWRKLDDVILERTLT